SRLFASPVGRLLYTHLNLPPRVLLPNTFADRRKLSREVHRHYLAPFAKLEDRFAPWTLARELSGSNDWYEELWRRRETLASLPTLLIWGLKRRLIPPRHLGRWRQALPDAAVVELQSAGHFVQEEAGDGL